MLWTKDTPKADVVIRGARVLDPVEGIDAVLDVRVDDGTIAAVGTGLDANGHRVVEGERLLDERTEYRGRVDDRIGVRQRDDRAVPPCRGGRGARRDRLLVLAAGRPQMHVRVDEGGCQDEPRRRGRDCIHRGHDPLLDRHARRHVEPLAGVDDPGANREGVEAAVAADERHATSSAGAATWRPGAVSRS